MRGFRDWTGYAMAVALIAYFAAFLAATGARWPWCGPKSGCGISSWLYDFQTILTGIAAIAAAVIAVGGQIYFSKKAEKLAKDDKDRLDVSLGYHVAMALGPCLLSLGENIEARRIERNDGRPICLSALEASVAFAERGCFEARIALRTTAPAITAKLIGVLVRIEAFAVHTREFLELAKVEGNISSAPLRAKLDDLIREGADALQKLNEFAERPDPDT